MNIHYNRGHNKFKRGTSNANNASDTSNANNASDTSNISNISNKNLTRVQF